MKERRLGGGIKKEQERNDVHYLLIQHHRFLTYFRIVAYVANKFAASLKVNVTTERV